MRVSPRIRLIVAAVLFAGWMAWLGYAALTKSRGPVVSRSQAAAATDVVEASIAGGNDGKPAAIEVVESFKGGLTAGTKVEVVNLTESDGFAGDGRYLVLLVKDRTSDAYRVAVPPRSPGYEFTARPRVYPWSEEIRKQSEVLFRRD
jgi:hypothetical protein